MAVSLKKFSNEVVTEMKKVSWPTKDQLRESTIVVIVVTLIITGFVAAIDAVFSQVIEFLF